MFAVTVNSNLLGERLDAGFYRPTFLSMEKALREKGAVRLETLVDSVACGPFGGNAIADDLYARDGVAFIRPVNISSHVFDDSSLVRVPKKNLAANGLKIYQGTNIYFGRVGDPCVAIIEGESSISPNIIIACTKGDLADPYYIYSFAASSFGLQQLKRQLKTVAQPTTSTDAIRELLVFKPENAAQKYIGDKVRQAERLRALGKKLSGKLEGAVEAIFAGNPRPLKAHRSHVSKDMLLEKRLDAEFYSPESLWAESEITKSKYGFAPLGNLATRIKDGPGGWGVSTNDYQESGVPVIRSVNIVDGECDLSDCVYISEKKHQDLISHEAKRGCVLLSVRGTIGRAAVFTDRYYRVASLNAAVVTIDCKDEINPYFLAAFLNSPIGKIQANRIANGAVQLNMNLTETASNLVVTPPQTIQDAIAEIYKAKIEAKNASKHLTTVAKLLVEALIEGQLTEAELIAAEQALQAGNDQLDRRILNRLKTDGVDGEGPALFGDLDELYRLLTQAEED
ncbi:hypothetical protein [Desulfuromonas thiophila]|uniref:hypothetical protein n=1 Tax=Desulfuromonas thiophila TaxID=57664 RepID=UPI0024A7B124|nr:hypothetical protein [Desulfuromonas thiophila]